MIGTLGWAIAAMLVMLTVLVHYEAMLGISDRLIPWAQRRFQGRRVIIFSVGALMMAHVAEIWLFALAIFIASHLPGFTPPAGDFDGDIHAFLYFSAVNYTAIGNSDIHLHGPLRSITVTETLTGLMMIAWSASFTYLKMEQIWKGHRP